jgi:hypothetical protein
MIILLPVVFLLGALFGTQANATTHAAASCNTSDVQAAVNAAASGDTVTIPACSQTNWSSTVTITAGITLQGAGQGQTIIGDNTSKACGGTGPFLWNVSAPNGFRMTGMTLVLVSNDVACQVPHIDVRGSTHSMRIDHITMTNAPSPGIKIIGDVWGVIDHINFSGNFSTGVRVEHVGWNGTSNDNWGDTAWAAPISYGSIQGVYIEDSSFTELGNIASTSTDCYQGGHIIFRHNTVSKQYVGTHGADSDQRHRACRWMEIYNNNFSYPSTIQALGFIAWIRGGTGVFYNNTITAPGYSNKIVQASNCRDADAGCGGGPNYTPWGACNGSSPYDQNSSGGHRCVDQPGSGTSNLLGPDPGGTITPANTWVGNISDPIYVWNNTLNGSSNNTTTGSTNVIVNRDYYVGTSRPGYTAYTYPHPLQVQATGTAPTAPGNLHATVQ